MTRLIPRVWRHWLCAFTLLTGGTAVAQESKTSSPPRLGTKKKMKPQPLHPKKKAPTSPAAGRFGVGIGLFSVYLPQPTIEGLWRYDAFVLSAEFGALSLGGKQYTANSSYIGAAGRYLFAPGFFGGLGIGTRRITVTTESDVVVGDVATPIEWTRKANHMVLTPKVGWEAFSNGTSLSLSLGVLLPVGTRFTTTRNVATVAGLSDEDLAMEQEKKGNDVRKVTDVTSPYVEVKYGWFF